MFSVNRDASCLAGVSAVRPTYGWELTATDGAIFIDAESSTWRRVYFASSSCSVQEKGHPKELDPPPPHIHNYSLYQIIRSSSSFLRFTCTSWHSLGGFIYTDSGKDLETKRKLPKGSLALYKTTSYTRLAELLGEFKEGNRRPPEDLVLRDLGAKSWMLIYVASNPNPIPLSLVPTITYERGAFIYMWLFYWIQENVIIL